MMPPELTYERAVARITRFMLIIAALGTAASFAARGWRWGVGFFLGSVISGVNFYFLKRLVDRLGGARRGGGKLLMILHFLLLGACIYGIFRVSPNILPAALAGVFVFTAAVFVEVIVEIAYARK